MDDELTNGFSDQCAQCGAICWAVSDGGQFFCKNCHNLIERTTVVDESTDLQNNRISSVASVKRKQNESKEGRRKWMVCEGFQFILKHQAEALVALGVCPQFKTDVLWNFWTRYLQKTGQAFTKVPLISTRHVMDQTHESDAESVTSGLDDAASVKSATSVCSGYSSDGRSSVRSGSVDAVNYCNTKERKKQHLMTMPYTLALCHLALLWIREAVTLADLLRLVSSRRIPYINAHELFPEEMKLYGRDALIFRVETIPSYAKVHREAVQLAKILELPTFPAVSPDCLLHPALLSLRYLMDVNLPNKLHYLVCQVIDKTAMGSENFLTFDPTVKRPVLLSYDLQAAALIIVTMKLLFKLDDHVEWKLSKKACEKKEGEKKKKTTKGSKLFSLRRWFMIMEPALQRHRKKEDLTQARQEWKSKLVFTSSLKHRTVVLKRRHMVEQLQSRFHALAGTTRGQQLPSSSSPSFVFHWGKEVGADGPSLHHKSLACVLEKNKNVLHLVNRKYWHTALRRCTGICGDHFWEQESSLPRMYVWVLGLFSFLLGVDEAQLHKEVVQVEHHLLMAKPVHRADARQPPRGQKT